MSVTIKNVEGTSSKGDKKNLTYFATATFISEGNIENEKEYAEYLRRQISCFLLEPIKHKQGSLRVVHLLQAIKEFKSRYPSSGDCISKLSELFFEVLHLTIMEDIQAFINPSSKSLDLKSYIVDASNNEDVPSDGNSFFWAAARQLIHQLKVDNTLINTLDTKFVEQLNKKLPQNLKDAPFHNLLMQEEINSLYMHPVFKVPCTQLEYIIQATLRIAVADELDKYRLISAPDILNETFIERVDFIYKVLISSVNDRLIPNEVENEFEIISIFKQIKIFIEELKTKLNFVPDEKENAKIQPQFNDVLLKLIKTENGFIEKWNKILIDLKKVLLTDGYYVGEECFLLMSSLMPNIVIQVDVFSETHVVEDSIIYFKRKKREYCSAILPTLNIAKVPWPHYNSENNYSQYLFSNSVSRSGVSPKFRPASLDETMEMVIRGKIRKILSVSKQNFNSNEEVKQILEVNSLNASVSGNLLDSFPYEISSKRRGVIPSDEKGEFFYSDPSQFQSKFSKPVPPAPYRVIVNIPFYAGSNRTVSEVVQIFENTGFEERKTSVEKSARSLVFVIGINMMESIDPDRNTKVKQKLEESLKTECEVHRFGFYWRPKWQTKEGDSVSFDEVRKHYLEIKKKNPVLARNLLDRLEKTTLQMVPYRELREVIKQHYYTDNLAKFIRQQAPDTPLYLGLFDPDMISASSVFDTYTKLIESHRTQNSNHPPQVLTTGYRLPHLSTERHDSPIYAFSVELDMTTRYVTANYVKNGVYYPEPNILVLINADKITESFMQGATLKNPKEYDDSFEWPIFMEDLIKTRELDPNLTFIFGASNPIITTMPDRMQYVLGREKERIPKIFYGQFNNSEQIVRWRISDIRYLIEVSQSHASPNAWASRLIRSLPLNWVRKVPFTTKSKQKKGIDIKDLIKPLEKSLKILFEQLDPLSILLREQPKAYEPRSFYKLLSSYDEFIPKCIADDKIKIEQEKISESIRTILDTSHNKLEDLFRKYKNQDIQEFILYVLGPDIGSRYIKAGFFATKALTNLYKSKLNHDFSKQMRFVLDNFYQECSDSIKKKYASDIPFTKTQEAILDGFYDPDNPLFKPAELLQKGKYNLTGLHIAALVGDSKLVSYALKNITSTLIADANLLPLHCAILYLATNGVSETNGNDIPLITLLVSNEGRFVKTDLGLTALGLALTRLENAGSVVKQCMINWLVPDVICDQIEKMARYASLKERRTPLLAIMNKVPKYWPRTIYECAKHGFSYLEKGVIENRIVTGTDFRVEGYPEITKLEEIYSTALSESVRQNNRGVFNEIKIFCLENGIKISSEIRDKDERPLAISAIINCSFPEGWLIDLKKLGAPLAVTDPSDNSPILHEAIFPASSRRLGGDARDQRRYKDGIKKFLDHFNFRRHETIPQLLAILFLLNEPDIDPNLVDAAGDRPIDIALGFNYPIIALFLIRSGAKINHLEEKQLEFLAQWFGLLYVRNEIDKDELKQLRKKRADIPNLFWEKVDNVMAEVEKMWSEELGCYYFSEALQSNYEALFKWLEEKGGEFSSTISDKYVRKSFDLYCINFEEVVKFYSLPIDERTEECRKIHKYNLEFHQKITDFQDNFLTKVTKAVNADIMKERVIVQRAEKNKTKALKKELKKNGFTPKQIKQKLHSRKTNFNLAKVAEIDSDKKKDEKDIHKNSEGALNTKSNFKKDQLQKAALFSTKKPLDLTVVSEAQPLSYTSLQQEEIQKMANPILSEVMKSLKDRGSKLYSKQNEEEIFNYIIQLINEESSKVSGEFLCFLTGHMTSKNSVFVPRTKELQEAQDAALAMRLQIEEFYPSDTSKKETQIKEVETTAGYGDCAFHAAFGKKIKGDIIYCNDVSDKRKFMAEKIRKAKPGDPIFPLIERAIQAILMSQGQGFTKLRKEFESHVALQEKHYADVWAGFEIELKKHQEIQKYIIDNTAGKSQLENFRKQFHDCLNLNEGLLYGLVVSEPILSQLFENYNKITNKGFNLEKKIIDDPQILEEYAAFIQRPGQWLLPVDIQIMAHVFQITIKYASYNPYKRITSSAEFYNGGHEVVSVRFNGFGHYERKIEVPVLGAENAIAASAKDSKSTSPKEKDDVKTSKKFEIIMDELNKEKYKGKEPKELSEAETTAGLMGALGEPKAAVTYAADNILSNSSLSSLTMLGQIKVLAIANDVKGIINLSTAFKAVVNINAYCDNWGSVLHHAAKAGSLDAMVYLVVELGANMQLNMHPKIKRSQTPEKILQDKNELEKFNDKKKLYIEQKSISQTSVLGIVDPSKIALNRK